MRSKKYGSYLEIEDHLGMDEGTRPVVIGMGKRELLTMDSQDILSYGELPYIETRTGESFKRTLRPDDRTVNDDREYQNHLEPFTRNNSSIGRQTIGTNAEKDIAYPLPKPSFKLRSRNAKNSPGISQISSKNLEIDILGPETKPSDLRKDTVELRNLGIREDPQIEVRISTPIKEKVSIEDPLAKRNSGFDISFLSSLGGQKMHHVNKIKKSVEISYAPQTPQQNIETAKFHPFTHKEQKQEELRQPKSSRDVPNVEVSKIPKRIHKEQKQEELRQPKSSRDVPNVEVSRLPKRIHKEQKQEELVRPKSFRDVPNVEISRSSKRIHKEQKQEELRQSKSSRDVPNVEFQRTPKSAHKERKQRNAVQKIDRDRHVIHQTEGRQEKIRSKKKDKYQKEVRSKEFVDIEVMQSSLHSTLESVKAKSENTVFSELAEGDKNIEVSAKPKENETLEKGETTKPMRAEDNVNITSASKSSQNPQKKSPQLDVKPFQTIAERPEIHSKSREKQKGVKSKGSMKIQTSTKERPEISYVKHDPSVKIMEDKNVQSEILPKTASKEKSIEIVSKLEASDRDAIKPISGSLEGEDDEKLEEENFIPKGPKIRNEGNPSIVETGIDSDKRIENTKNILIFN